MINGRSDNEKTDRALNIGRVIELRRKGCYLSQGKLAALSGVHKKTVNWIERGLVDPHKSTVQLIMYALDEEEKRIEKMRKEVGLL